REPIWSRCQIPLLFTLPPTCFGYEAGRSWSCSAVRKCSFSTEGRSFPPAAVPRKGALSPSLGGLAGGSSWDFIASSSSFSSFISFSSSSFSSSSSSSFTSSSLPNVAWRLEIRFSPFGALDLSGCPSRDLEKCLRLNPDVPIWTSKQRILCTLNHSLKDVLNYGLFQPAFNGRAGKFLDEERLLREYPLNPDTPVPYLEFRYKRRVYSQPLLDDKQFAKLHTK
ncbi:hypothetical protein E2320_004447, partial [Naja naja]